MEAHQAIPKAGTNSEIGTTRIVVDGAGTTHYDRVRTTGLDAWISVQAPDKPARDKKKLHGSLTLESGSLSVAHGFPGHSTIYKIGFKYVDPPSHVVANQRISPIKLCNDRLNALSGSARDNFLHKGTTFLLENAYTATAKQSWEVRKKNSLFHEVKSWSNYASIHAVIECRALQGPKPRSTTKTSGSGASPPAKGPSPEPATPRRVSPPSPKPTATATINMQQAN